MSRNKAEESDTDDAESLGLPGRLSRAAHDLHNYGAPDELGELIELLVEAAHALQNKQS